MSDYARYSRPIVMRMLEACRLDVAYHRAEGDSLWTRDAQGHEREVLDMVGGFGVGLLGHNHPKLLEVVRRGLDARIPFHAQGSHRETAGELCRRLSELVGTASGRRYVVTLANTGTEGVEAAIKHAELERDAKVQAIQDGYREHHRSIMEKLRNRECDLVPRILNQVGERLGLPFGSDPDLEEIHHRVLSHNAAAAAAEPLFLALEGSFHGKTTGSLKLTWDPEKRHPFRRIGLKVRFLPLDDLEALDAAIAQSAISFLDLSIAADGVVVLEEKPFVNIAALFVEPIQGEGGIRDLDRGYLQGLERAARQAGFPLVLDEIQSGCGRTGKFLASEHHGVVGDYYVLSKALGGGLAKLSACLIDSARYQDAFGLLHTSTFGEDEGSCRIALAALDLITGPESTVLQQAEVQGARLKGGLEQLREQFPHVLSEVRGRGLMLGFQFARRDEAESPTVALLSSQRFLGFVIAGYLLHEAGIRVLPTLSQPETLRLEPSAFLSNDQLKRFMDAMRRVCRLLEADRGDTLIRYLASDPASPPPAPVEGTARFGRVRLPRPRRSVAIPPYAGRVAFLGHFIRPGHLRHWDAGLTDLDDASLGRFLDRTHRMLEPFVSESTIIESAIGERVHLSFVGIPITPDQIQRGFKDGNIRWLEDKILSGVRLARRQGASIVGLGGYTSILTGQGTRISEDRVGITSGNAMTVAMGVEALLTTAREQGIDLASSTLGALGATGNICGLYAQMLAEFVPRIILIGRPHMESRLRRVAGEIYFETYKLLQRSEPDAPLEGLAQLLRETETYRQLCSTERGLERIGPTIATSLESELGAAAPIRIATDPSALVDANLIVAASSTPDPIIRPEHLGPGPRVICDLALPEDTHPDVFTLRPDVTVIRGGIVQLPRNPTLALAGVPLEPGCVFACMAETLLLGLSRINEHFSWGTVTKLHVEAIRDLARYHGFTLSRAAMTSIL